MDAWIAEELRHAPAGLSHGWFISSLEFYDLQDSLSGGTLVAMALSVAVAFSVMLLTTWNVIISLYAILSIAGTIFVTVGSLVLLGWEMNVLESVTISVAVGLSVDFAVHYGVAYRLAPEPDREGKVIFSLGRMGSAIAMAALTTFVAGAMMMPSTVLAYTQLGTFMMLIMCISWAFATFFFQCMCRCLGPQGNCGQIPLPKKLQCQVFSEVTSAGPSSQGKGSYGGGGEAEHYELEPLASDQKTEDKPKEEQEVCAQLCNGISSHHHVGSSSNTQGKSKPAAGRNTTDNGIMVPLSLPLPCQYPQTTKCTCGDPPLSPQHQEWAPHPCAHTPQDSHTPRLLPRSANATYRQKAAAITTNLDLAYTHMDCHMHYVHCSPAHSHHHHSQGRMAAPRQGATPSCHLRNYCAHTASQQAGSTREQRSTAQSPDRSPGSAIMGAAVCQRRDAGRSSPDGSQNLKPPSPKQPRTQDPAPASDAPRSAGVEAKDGEPCPGDTPIPTTTDTAVQRDGQTPGNSVPVTREESVKTCKQNPKSQGASCASPKRLYCYNRTLRTKCSSTSEFNVPKSETSVPPVAINAKHSPESLC